MGFDIAVSFMTTELDIVRFSELVFSNQSIHEFYVVKGAPTTKSGNKYHFSVWANDEMEFIEILCGFSNVVNEIVTVWKSEHGGVGGFLQFKAGDIVAQEAIEGESYLHIPVQGFQNCYEKELDLEEYEKLFFPEILLDKENCKAFCIKNHNSISIRELSSDELLELIEYELDAEIILPV